MKVAFTVIGRPFNPDVNADGLVRNEPAIVLKQLAERHPDVTWYVPGRTTGAPWTLPSNVWHSSRTEFDQIVVWLAGGFAALRQNTPRRDGLPQRYRRTLAVYTEPIADILQAHEDDVMPVWIVNDPRSYFRARDVKKPRSILCQHDFVKDGVQYRAVGTDMAAVPWYDPVQKSGGKSMLMELVASTAGKHGRREAIERWDAYNWYPLNQKMYAIWLRQAADTILFPPSSRSRWITAKFWECAANGVIPWLAEGYDSQNISGINDVGLDFLRVFSPEDLKMARDSLFRNPMHVQNVRDELRRLYEQRYCATEMLWAIEDRLGLL